MESRVLLSAIFLVILALVSSSQAIKCYVCNSFYHHDCGDEEGPIKGEYLHECTPETALPLEAPGAHGKNRKVTPMVPMNAKFTVCRKNIVTVPIQDNGNYTKKGTIRVIRSCGWENPTGKDACKWAAASGIQLYMCECPHDACNSAPAMLPAIGSVLLLVVGAWSLR